MANPGQLVAYYNRLTKVRQSVYVKERPGAYHWVGKAPYRQERERFQRPLSDVALIIRRLPAISTQIIIMRVIAFLGLLDYNGFGRSDNCLDFPINLPHTVVWLLPKR